MIGTQVGSWVLQKLLGAGGMGRVYLAEHVMMKDLWAVKILAEELTQREDIVRRFVNEARAAAKVRHRNLVRVVHVDQVPSGPWYMVLEYLEGTTLGAFLVSQTGPIPYAFIVRTLCQVANALQTIHNHGIVHRDIKADNIFLVAREGDDRLPIVLDLGVAFLGEHSEGVATGRGAVIGTPCYMAPEQLLGQPVGPTADVYALGVLVYQMSTGGWFPYQQDAETFNAYVQLAPAELYRRQSAEALIDPRKRNPGISDAWARMIYALLAVDVSRRTHDARTAGLELARALPSDGAMIDGLGIVRQYAKELLQTDDLRVTLQSQMPKVIVTPGSEARYALGAKIGAGGMAEVFAGTQIGEQGFERPVAIKRILSELSSQPGFAAMFIAEARIVSRLAHPNVVSVIDFRKDEQERWFLVMEYVEGKDLRALLDAGPLPPSTIIFLIVEMLRGLGYAHVRVDSVTGARGLVHRDMSPENVLLSYEGDVKVNDFGLARMKDVRGRAGTTRIAGKPGYMSPEQVRGDALDQRSDLWAVGVMLWEMLACQQMLTGTALEVMGQVQFKTIPPPSTLRADVPADLEAIAMRLLQRDPDLRYPSASQVIDDLVQCSDAPRNGRDELAVQLAARFRPTSPHVPRSVTTARLGELTRSQPPVGTPTTLGSAASQAVVAPSTRDTGKRRLFVGALASFLVVVAAIAGITAFQRRATSASGVTPAHTQPATPSPAAMAPVGDGPVLPLPIDARVPIDDDAAATPDAPRPVDARQLDAAIEDASVPLAAQHHPPTTTHVEPQQALPTSRIVPRPGAGPAKQRSDRRRGSDDTYNPNAAGGDD